jgi:endogenous inhibitor of DNA gyrase (YacG/DUF329 family)
MPSADSKAGQPKAKPCPTCGKPAVEKFRPFCSSRCRDVDLNRWLTGTYAIPAVDDDEDESSGGESQG